MQCGVAYCDEQCMQVVLQAISRALPATIDRLSLAFAHEWASDAAPGGSIEEFVGYLRIWKAQYALDGRFWAAVNSIDSVVANCNEMIRGSLQGPGGFPMERLIDHSLLAPPEHGETVEESGVGILNDCLDAEDEDDLLGDLLL